MFLLNLILVLIAVIKLIDANAVPPPPSSAPALPNIPGITSIVEDLIKVVEKAKSRWDALQNGYGSRWAQAFKVLIINILNWQNLL